MRTSEGIDAIGQGGAGECSVDGRLEGILRVEKDAISSDNAGRGEPFREWWAGFSIVTAALEGLEVVDAGGKCLFL